jgi:hypothetical protein
MYVETSGKTSTVGGGQSSSAPTCDMFIMLWFADGFGL